MPLCAAALALLLGGCDIAELKGLGTQATQTVGRTMDRAERAVDQSEALTKQVGDEALVAVRQVDTAADDAEVERVTKRFDAKLKIIRKARDDRNDHGPALVLEKLVERIDALIEKLKD